MRIFVFNPEHDYALASFADCYTPPKTVIELRRRLALCQARLALPGDAILILDNPSPQTVEEFAALNDSGLKIFPLADLRKFLKNLSNSQSGTRNSPSQDLPLDREIEFHPWGWDPSIRHTLLNAGTPEALLPSMNYLKSLRELSHRRTTIPFNCLLNHSYREMDYHAAIAPLPVEIKDAAKAESMLAESNPLFFKAPWSSSGRGILPSEEFSTPKCLQWVNGIIKRQGCVLCEEAADKTLDFASEWLVKDGHVDSFLGFSLFSATPSGRYICNLRIPQPDILEAVKSKAPLFNPGIVIEAQRRAIDTLLDSQDCRYSGHLGIDMLTDSSGKLRTAIELNFRTTMGVINLIEEKRQKDFTKMC